MDSFGSIFSDKVDMGNKSGDIRAKYQRDKNSSDVVQDRRNSGVFDYLHALFKQAKEQMATVNIGWILFNILGWPTAVLTMLSAIFGDIAIGDISEPYRSIIVILGLVFMVVKILTAYEVWQEKHIANHSKYLDNAERALELQRKINSQPK